MPARGTIILGQIETQHPRGEKKMTKIPSDLKDHRNWPTGDYIIESHEQGWWDGWLEMKEIADPDLEVTHRVRVGGVYFDDEDLTIEFMDYDTYTQDIV